jgi:hypothetical protein
MVPQTVVLSERLIVRESTSPPGRAANPARAAGTAATGGNLNV